MLFKSGTNNPKVTLESFKSKNYLIMGNTKCPKSFSSFSLKTKRNNGRKVKLWVEVGIDVWHDAGVSDNVTMWLCDE